MQPLQIGSNHRKTAQFVANRCKLNQSLFFCCNVCNMITALYRRNIKPGTEYNDLIPDSVCHSTFRGDGDTYHSMDLIQEFIEDYSDQVSKLAPQLKADTVEETVNNIYDFLYNHIQYKADGAAQEIRSPQCTWHSRSRGADCKSFSVFAGALCKELGIPFSIRKIQQPGDSDGNFSHVYIIVHQNNKPHLVIDATKHENTESFYIKKHDINMKHYGLNASRVTSNQNNCAFHDYFGRICNTLSDSNVCSTQINKLKENVNDHIKKTGHYPMVSVEVDTIYINGTPNKFTNSNGATVLVATKAKGLNSSAINKGADIAKKGIVKAIPKVLSSVKNLLSNLWAKFRCAITSSAWSTGEARRYESNMEEYFNTIINKISNQSDAYHTPNNLGETQFTKDLNKAILELWTETAKWQFEQDTYGSKHNRCTRDNRSGVIGTSQAYYKGIQELYQEVIKDGYPLISHMVQTNPLMDFHVQIRSGKSENTFTEVERTARAKKYNNPIPKINLPQVTVDIHELEKLDPSIRPNIPGSGFVSVPGFDTKLPPSGGGGGFAESIGEGGFAEAIKKPPTGTNNPPTFHTADGIVAKTNQPQKAGFSFLPALLIAGTAYGIYESQKKKKK